MARHTVGRRKSSLMVFLTGWVFFLPLAVSFAQSVSFTFTFPKNFAVGSAPASVAIGDFNRDGKLDLAAVNENSGNVFGNVSILLGDDTGAFGTATNFATAGFAPVSVAIGDFNLDGKLDLAMAHLRGDTVSILLGDGAGSFGAATHFSAGILPRSVATGDFNRDGKLDLAVANDIGAVSILLGNGTGFFGAATDFAVGPHPASVAIGDFNRDGKRDLAVANSGNDTVSILLGTGTGAFGPATNLAVPGPYGVANIPISVAIEDLNRDGKLDLAVANYRSSGGSVSVLLGDGTGFFGAATDFAVGTHPTSVAIEDLDGDGKLDLAVANEESDSVSVLLGDGTGSFGAAMNFVVGRHPSSVALGDFNRDGKLDLAVANSTSNDVSILLNIILPNLVRNPSFESDTAGWAAFSGSTIQRVAGGVDGAYSLEVNGPSTMATFGVNDKPNWVATTPAAGTRYRLTAWVSSQTNAGAVRLRVREFNNGLQLGGSTNSASMTLSSSWQMITMDYVAQAAGSTLDLQVLDDPVATGEVFQVDDISIGVVP